MSVKVFESSEGNVSKYVFTTNTKVYETVLYKYESYEKRTVICCSVQSGCPVGCTFCGTGKKFISNLSSPEIIHQIRHVLHDKGIDSSKIEKFQIMFMSMGEPMLNWKNVEEVIFDLNELYPSAQLLLSTIGVDDDITFRNMVHTSKAIDKVGLQFSIHKSTDEQRNELIPYKKKYKLREIRDRGLIWSKETGRPVYLNYCIDGTNNTQQDIENLKNMFNPQNFYFTFSVVCDADENMQGCSYRNIDKIREMEKSFIEEGYNTRVFDPAGQDDIGGGCGQLWYVQEWMRNNS